MQQIPDPRMHMVRYAGAYANRVRRRYRAEEKSAEVAAEEEGKGRGLKPGLREDLSEREARRRASWARMIRRIYEVNALACPRCGDELKIVSVILELLEPIER